MCIFPTKLPVLISPKSSAYISNPIKAIGFHVILPFVVFLRYFPCFTRKIISPLP